MKARRQLATRTSKTFGPERASTLRVENVKLFDEFLARRFPESQRKA
jgi:hypothetical protein